ncbi:MAG: hypothetical protein IPL39_16145 [Opitutaceae bacterium]|nr:hypothetical protein [Opitutaceae bacterium]
MTESDRQTVMESIEQQVDEQPAQPGAIVPFVPRDVTPATEDDELSWSAQLEAQRKQQAAEAAEKAKASKGKGRRTSTGGVVATEADGRDLTDPDESKNQN